MMYEVEQSVFVVAGNFMQLFFFFFLFLLTRKYSITTYI